MRCTGILQHGKNIRNQAQETEKEAALNRPEYQRHQIKHTSIIGEKDGECKMKFRTCPYCGANLDPEEKCDCLEGREREDRNNDGNDDHSEHSGAGAAR